MRTTRRVLAGAAVALPLTLGATGMAAADTGNQYGGDGSTGQHQRHDHQDKRFGDHDKRFDQDKRHDGGDRSSERSGEHDGLLGGLVHGLFGEHKDDHGKDRGHGDHDHGRGHDNDRGQDNEQGRYHTLDAAQR